MTKKKTLLNYVDAGVTGIAIVGLWAVHAVLNPFIKAGSLLTAVSKSEKLATYRKNVWLGEDNNVSSNLGGHWEDTLSSRLGKAQEAGSKVLGFIANRVDNLWLVALDEEGHCKKAIELRNNDKQVTGR